MIDHQDSTLKEPIGQPVAHRCPHLGTRIDPDTWFTFPADENYCHKASPIQPVNKDYQVSHCLAAKYGECPVYMAKQTRWVGSLPKQIKGKTSPLANVFNARNFLIVGGVIGLLTL